MNSLSMMGEFMRWVLHVEYFGYPFHGWQKQPSVETVQTVLERALSQVAGESISVVAAGRTDAGVHALGQVVHFDTRAVRHSAAWVRGANRYLPDAVRVCAARPAPDFFHARRSARTRRYRYVLYQNYTRPALYARRVSWIHQAISEDAIREALPLVIGEHDFSSFRGAACQALSPVRHVHTLTFCRKDHFFIFEIEANSFLQHMVRNLVGAFLLIGRGGRPPSWLSLLLQERNRSLCPATAAPDGLYLLSVQYPAKYDFLFGKKASDACFCHEWPEVNGEELA